tara:strand:+ start:741 stop:1280 length:540 start_codon:yes stop_codon:yes gene_type:complete
MFTEQFGFSGHTKPVKPVLMKGTNTDLSDYEESGEELEVSNDLMQEMVLATNKEVSKKTGLCTYIIETLSVKKYTNKKSNQEIYRCMFMTVKHKGFALGFSVTSDLRIIEGKAVVLNMTTQPIDVKPPSDPSIYQKSIKGKEFEDYTEVRQSEIDIVKNTLIIDKVIPNSQTMYGKDSI